MPIEPRNPFYASLAAIEQELPDRETLDRTIGEFAGAARDRLTDIAAALEKIAVDGPAVLERGIAAMDRIARNTEAETSVRPLLGVALLLLLVDRNRSWDRRFDVSAILIKAAGSEWLDVLDANRRGTQAGIERFIGAAGRGLRSDDNPDALFRSIADADLRRFCEMVPLLLDLEEGVGTPSVSPDTEARPSRARGRTGGPARTVSTDDPSRTASAPRRRRVRDAVEEPLSLPRPLEQDEV